MRSPLDGESEGWPAVAPEAVQYLAGKGARHTAIDAPSIGFVDPNRAAMTYWTGAKSRVVVSEYLTGAAQLPPTGTLHVFLNPKIENARGGPGRDVAILPYGQPRAARR